MKKQYNEMKNILILIILIGMLSACSESYLDDFRTDPTSINDEAFWNKTSNAERVLASNYSTIFGRRMYSRILPHLLSALPHHSDLDWTANSDWVEWNNNEYTPLNSDSELLWRTLYQGIQQSNDLLIHWPDLETTADISQEKIDDWAGQSLFIRALCYFHLVNLWGEAYPAGENAENALGVPLVLTVPDTEEEFYATRVTVQEIYTQMEEDLLDAIELLPPDIERGRFGIINEYVARTLLGKVYLYQEKYDLAINQFETIMDADYTLADTIDHNWDGLHDNINNEAIFEIDYTDASLGLAGTWGVQTSGSWGPQWGSNPEGTFGVLQIYFSPEIQGGRQNFYVHERNVPRFGSDPRLHESILVKDIDSVVVTNAGKWSTVSAYNSSRKFMKITEPTISQPTHTNTPNIVVFRLSDIYLMYAEAMNANGNDEIAAEYMNKVRRRAYYQDPEVPDASIDYDLTGTALRDTIRVERYRELFHEFDYWYDINRWGILEEEISYYMYSSTTPNLQYRPEAAYLPIPLTEVQRNSNCPQSKGYN